MSKYDNEGGFNYGLMVIIAILAAVVSSFVTYKATSSHSGRAVVVDIDRVAISSKSAMALKTAREGQLERLRVMREEADRQIKAETDSENKQKLADMYAAEINSKKDQFDKQYAAALQTLNQTIQQAIGVVAEKKGVKVIYSPDSVVLGSEDITDEVIKSMQ